MSATHTEASGDTLTTVLLAWYESHGNCIEDDDYDYENEPFKVAPELVQALQAHIDAECNRARIDELRILQETDAEDPNHELDIPSYVEWRESKLSTQPERKPNAQPN